MEGQMRVLGTPIHFEWGGKSFDIPRWNFEVEGMFSAWVVDQSEKRIKASRLKDGEAEYRAKVDGLRRDIDKGLYEWGSEIVVSRWSSPSGAKHLLWLTLSRLDKTITPAWVDELANDRTAWEELWEKLLRLNFPTAPEPVENPAPEAASR